MHPPPPLLTVAFSNHGDVDVEAANPTAYQQTHIVVNYLPLAFDTNCNNQPFLDTNRTNWSYANQLIVQELADSGLAQQPPSVYYNLVGTALIHSRHRQISQRGLPDTNPPSATPCTYVSMTAKPFVCRFPNTRIQIRVHGCVRGTSTRPGPCPSGFTPSSIDTSVVCQAPAGQCANNGVFNSATGSCTCTAGWTGGFCDVPLTCQVGKYTSTVQ